MVIPSTVFSPWEIKQILRKCKNNADWPGFMLLANAVDLELEILILLAIINKVANVDIPIRLLKRHITQNSTKFLLALYLWMVQVIDIYDIAKMFVVKYYILRLYLRVRLFAIQRIHNNS